MTEELATQQSALPALAYNPAQELTAEDISTPRVKIAQGLSQVVTDGLVPLFALYSQQGQDDPAPQVLAKPGDTKGVRFYVLSVKKGYSYKDVKNDLQSTPNGEYPDLSLVLNGDPKKVSRTFDYTIVLPDSGSFIPFKLLLTRTGGQAAKYINTQLVIANLDNKDGSHVAFVLTAVKRSNDDGTFGVPIVNRADVPAVQLQKDLEVVETLRARVSPSQPTPTPSVPAISAPALD